MSPEEALKYFSELKTAYQVAFGAGHGTAVTADLTVFCRGKESCGVPGDHDRTWLAIGRHEVWLRIREFLELTPEDLVALHTRPAQGATSHARSDPQSES